MESARLMAASARFCENFWQTNESNKSAAEDNKTTKSDKVGSEECFGLWNCLTYDGGRNRNTLSYLLYDNLFRAADENL